MSYTSELLTGLGAFLAESGIGIWRESGVYQPDELGITIADMLDGPGMPNEIICLTPYSSQDRMDIAVTSMRIQIRHRVEGSPLRGMARCDAVRNLLHRHPSVSLGPVRISRIEHKSTADLGKDKSGRREYTQNFEFTGLRWLHPIITPPSGATPNG